MANKLATNHKHRKKRAEGEPRALLAVEVASLTNNPSYNLELVFEQFSDTSTLVSVVHNGTIVYYVCGYPKLSQRGVGSLRILNESPSYFNKYGWVHQPYLPCHRTELKVFIDLGVTRFVKECPFQEKTNDSEIS